MKTLQVPYNLEKNCLSMYANWAEYIQDIYFAASPEVFPTARVWEYQDDYFEQQLKLIAFCKVKDIRSCLLLNGVDFQLRNDRLDALKEYLKILVDAGLDVVVIANPILCEWVKKLFPNLTIRLSILSLEYTLPKIINFYETGLMDEICLPPEFSHDEDGLKELKRVCPNLKLSTIINSICRQNCPLYFWHQALYNSNRTREDDVFMSQILDASLDIMPKMTNSFKQIAFLLPEELDYYDKYFDGYKVEGRTWSTITLEQRIQYMALRVNPTFLRDYLTIAWCCNAPQDVVIDDLDKNWLKYRRNCKNTCWRCKYDLYCKKDSVYSGRNS